MKALMVLIVLFGFIGNAQADEDVGHLVLVEREITNVYDRCLKTLSPSVDRQSHLCGMKIIKDPYERLYLIGRAYTYRVGYCDVFGEFGTGSLMLFFQSHKPNSNQQDDLNCLRDSLELPTRIIATIQTLEPLPKPE
jgi:hypothetical protein